MQHGPSLPHTHLAGDCVNVIDIPTSRQTSAMQPLGPPTSKHRSEPATPVRSAHAVLDRVGQQATMLVVGVGG
jgi:hypothetical protein